LKVEIGERSVTEVLSVQKETDKCAKERIETKFLPLRVKIYFEHGCCF
jgi:hypothetical protein